MAIGRPIEQTPNIADKVVTATATAGQTEFTVTGGYRINHLAVFRNGVRLVNGNDFTALDGVTVTLMEDAANLDVLEFQVFDSFSVSDALLTNSSSQTVNGDVTVVGTFTVGSGGIGTFVAAEVDVGIVSSTTGITTIQSLQASSSTTTGALVVKGGVGIGKSLYVGGNLSVGGTVTYEDITNVDSVGLVTAGKGFRATTGGLVVTAGVSTFAGLTTVTNTAAFHSKQLNVSAGSTFGGAITASDNLTFAGTLADSDGFSVTGGNVIIPSYITHDGDTNTKFGFLGADGYSVTTGGTEAFRVDSSQRLLVGTTAGWGSDVKLHLGSSANTYSVITSGTSHNGVLAFSDDGTERGSIDYDHNGDYMAFKTAASERLRITSAGKVGIASAVPLGDLDIRNSSKANLIVAKDGLTVKQNSDLSTTYDMIQLGAGGALASYTIATATADTELVHNAYRHSGGNWKYRYQDTACKLLMNTPGGAFVFQSAASGNADADISFSEKLRIDSSGRLLLGTTTEGNANADDLTVATTGTTGVTIRSGTSSTGNIYFSDGTSGSDEFAGAVEYGHSTDSLRLHTGGSERLRIDSSGRVLIGHTATVDTSTYNSKLQVMGTDAHGSSGIFGRFSNDAGSPSVHLTKSRNGTTGSHTIVQDDDVVGNIFWWGSDGSDYEEVARVSGQIDGTPGNNDLPGRLTFSTTADGASTATERLRIDCRGFVGINESAPDEFLHISANNNGVSNSAFQSAGNTIRLTDTDTDVTSNQPGGTIEWETLDSSASGVNAYIATKNSNTGYSEMIFGTGNASTLTERLAIDQNGKILLGSTRSQYTNDYYDDITINNSGGSGATGGAGITMISDAASWGAVQFGDDNDDDVGYIKYNHNDDTMRFAAGTNDQQIIGSNVIDYFQHNAIMQKNGTVTISDGGSKTFTITGLAYGWAKIILGFYGEGQYCGVEVSLGGLMGGGSTYYNSSILMNVSSGSCSVSTTKNQTSYVITIANNVGNGGSLHGASMFYGGSVNDGHPAMSVS